MVYPIINAILVKNEADFCAAEAHGIATGMLCANEKTDSDYWLSELLHNAPAIVDEQRQLLIKLFEETRRLLMGDQFEFDLFLPKHLSFYNWIRKIKKYISLLISTWVCQILGKALCVKSDLSSGLI